MGKYLKDFEDEQTIAKIDADRYTAQSGATYTAAWGDRVLYSNSGGTITLTTAAGHTGETIKVIATGASGATVDGNGSETINGNTTITLAQYETVELVSDGTNVFVGERSAGNTTPGGGGGELTRTYILSTQTGVTSTIAVWQNWGSSKDIDLDSTKTYAIGISYIDDTGTGLARFSLRVKVAKASETDQHSPSSTGIQSSYVGDSAAGTRSDRFLEGLYGGFTVPTTGTWTFQVEHQNGATNVGGTPTLEVWIEPYAEI